MDNYEMMEQIDIDYNMHGALLFDLSMTELNISDSVYFEIQSSLNFRSILLMNSATLTELDVFIAKQFYGLTQ